MTPEQIIRLKNIIRYCDFGNFTTENALKYINSGILGYYNKKGSDGRPIPIVISERTYYRYKEETRNVIETRKEFLYFVRERYEIEMRNVLEVLREFFALTQQNLYQEKTPRDRQFIINSMIRNLPLYTQYLEAIRILVEKDKLRIRETPAEEKDGSAIRS